MDHQITPLNTTDNKKRFAIISAIILGLVIVFGIFIGFLRSSVIVPFERAYEVLPGATAREIAYDLASQHIIKYPWLFNFYLSLKDIDTKLEAGRYEFPAGKITMRGIAQILSAGSSPREITITIPEGYTTEQIADILVQKGLIKNKGDFLTIAKQRTHYSEGYLFPDTYRFFEDATAEEIIDKMRNNFEKKATSEFRKTVEFRQAIGQQSKTLDEIVIMASILEKEVKTEKDMQFVSDILWRRLDAGMLLEVDSTLNYILPKEERKSALTQVELEIDSPYNTYKYAGLPPTAISNPGLQALQAALNPLANEYWFYLSSTSGETIFARNYKEHLANKTKYLGDN